MVTADHGLAGARYAGNYSELHHFHLDLRDVKTFAVWSPFELRGIKFHISDKMLSFDLDESFSSDISNICRSSTYNFQMK